MMVLKGERTDLRMLRKVIDVAQAKMLEQLIDGMVGKEVGQYSGLIVHKL